MKKKVYLIFLSIFMAIIMVCNSTNITAQENHSHDIDNEEVSVATNEDPIEIGIQKVK